MYCPIASALALAIALAGCTLDPSPQAPTVPPDSILCKLRIGRSTAADTIALLGDPTLREGLPDGSLTLEYQYPSTSTLIDLHLDFNTQQVFVDAFTLNVAEPACWLPDAGAPTPTTDSAGDAGAASAAAPDGF